MAETAKYPAWREAIEYFQIEKFSPGDIVTYDWLYEHFLIERPTDMTPYGKAEKAQLAFLGQFKQFEEALLSEHQIALQNERGIGYKVVDPPEQTRWAETSGVVEVKKALRKLGKRLIHVDNTKLDGEQRRENAEALARLAMLSGMVKRVTERESVLKEITEEKDKDEEE